MKKQHKWLVFVILIIFSYLSSFIPVRVNEALLFRNITSDASVQGSTDQHGEASQIREIEIGKEEVDIPIQSKNDAVGEWGTAKQVGEHTWTMKVEQDAKNGTAQEMLSALNNYRQGKGKGTLTWDEKLANYAQTRAGYFVSRGDLDSHAGFTEYVNNQDGFHQLGFMSLGENSSYGYALEAVHLIEWVFAGDKPHDDNQLNSEWTHVGIGVSGTATDLIFGGKKL